MPSHAVPLHVAPDDYTEISSQPVTFSSAPSQMCVSVSISIDDVTEENEFFTVELGSTDRAVQFTLQSAIVTIMDGTCPPYIYFASRHRINIHAMHSWTYM